MLVENSELPPKGGDEPAIICMGGVLAPAVYDATGAKVLQLPVTPERVKESLKRTQMESIHPKVFFEGGTPQPSSAFHDGTN